MRRTLAVTLLALATLLSCLPEQQRVGPTSVLITEPGERATALYMNSEEYAELERLTSTGPVLDGRPPSPGRVLPPHLAGPRRAPWRADDIQIARRRHGRGRDAHARRGRERGDGHMARER